MARKKMEENDQGMMLDAGEVITSWETWEYPPVERSPRWYAVVALIGVGCLIYAILTANFLFAFIILMFGALTLLQEVRGPARVTAHVTSGGVVIGDEFYPFQDIRDFSITYEPPAKYLYIGLRNRFQPLLAIALEEADPDAIRQGLLPFVFEDLTRDGERLTDALHRVYKL